MVLGLSAPGEHEVLVFLCQIVAIVAVARALGWLLARVGQPAVVGELLAGIVLGPSVLGRVSSSISDWLFPDTPEQGAMLYGLAWLGLLLLLAATGLESDLQVLRRLGRPAILVSTTSLLVPLLGGFFTGLLIPESMRGTDTSPATFAAFLAVALSISSLPVVAKVLADLRLIRRNVGQLILAAAMANDVVGWVLLGLVAGLAHAGQIDLLDLTARAVGVVAFVAVSLTVGQRLVDRAIQMVTTTSTSIAGPATFVIGFVVAAGAVTQWIGVEAVLGAFIAGMIVGRSRWRDERVARLIETLGAGILAPLFFATAGLRVDLDVFRRGEVALWGLVVVGVASATKFFGAYTGATIAGLPRPERTALGVALHARGMLEIVIASVGLSIGVLNDASYGVIVVMAIATSVVAPPLLRRVLRDWSGTEEEQDRLRDEQRARSRLVVSSRPPLLLSRGRPPSIIAAQLLDLSWPRNEPVSVWSTEDRAELGPVFDVLAERNARHLRRRSPEVVAAVISDADRGHGAIFLGVADDPAGPPLSPFVESVLAAAHGPVVLVRGERMSGRPLPQAFARALVPVTGSINSRAALELASGLSATLGTELVLTHLDSAPVLPLPFGQNDRTRPLAMAEPLLRDAVDAARLAGAGQVATLASTAESVPTELVRLAVERDIDVVILGATRREGTAGYLGPVATHVLTVCPATVVIVATPPGWTGWRSN